MTGSYSLLIKRSAEKELKKLPADDLRRVVDRISDLAQSLALRVAKSYQEKLSGTANTNPTQPVDCESDR